MLNIKKILIAIIICCVSQAAHVATIMHDGLERRYIPIVPEDLGSHLQSVPLVIGLHGGGSSAPQMIGTAAFPYYARANQFIVAAPYASPDPNIERGFFNIGGDMEVETNYRDDVGFISKLIDTMIMDYPVIDPTRVYLMGHSNGAMMAYRFAAERPDQIAAIAVNSGAMVYTGAPVGPVPIIHTHGLKDDMVEPGGGVLGGVDYPPLDDAYIIDPLPDPPPYDTNMYPESTMRIWRGVNGLGLETDFDEQATTTVSVPVKDRDGHILYYVDSEVNRRRWNDTTGDNDIVLYTFSEGGHGWRYEADGLKATQVFWDFLALHQKCDGTDANECPRECHVPPLYFFYAIHTHGTGDYLPYTDVTQTQLHTETADNMIAAIDGIREVLDRYGVKGTWELVEGSARGIPAYQGEDHIFKQLHAGGHEIGAHAHRLEDLAGVVAALHDSCGIVPVTTSGFMTQVSKANLTNIQEAMSLALQTPVDLGLRVGTTNLSPGGGKNLVGIACANDLGVGNDMWSETGNLMYPWRPDYLHTNVCADNPEGGIVLVDHVSIEWLILPDALGPPDVLDDRHFEQLKHYFDAALKYMQENKQQRVACWGFVTHITEYAVGDRAEHPPEASAFAALDRFLAYVDTQRIQGNVVYATSSEIAALVDD